MLSNLNIEEILFLDIETVPLTPNFSKLSDNWKKLWEHKMQFKIESGELPVWRGLSLSGEDRLRRAVISAIMCQGRVRFDEFERKYRIDFSNHFAMELESLKPLQDDGLIELSDHGFDVTSTGLLLLRVIAMKFDEYLVNDLPGKSYSKVI